MKILRCIFMRGRSPEPSAPSDYFDVYHAKTLRAAAMPVAALEAGEAELLGAPVREFYLHNPEAQWRYPLGLLPIGQKRFVKWLLGKGRAQYHFDDQQILGFLQATARDLERHIVLTYRINAEWQRRFPKLSADGKELIAWLRAEFPKFRPLRKLQRLPRDAVVAGVGDPDRSARGAAADQPGSATQATLEGVNFLSHFCYPSGLQEAALGYCASLEAAGLRVSRRDVPAGVRTELEAREDLLGLEIFPVTITNVSPVPHFARLYERAGLATRPGIQRIAYWAWELETVPNEWSQLAESIDEIWTPTPFVATAMRAVMPRPVYDMLPGVRMGKIQSVPRAQFGIGESEFVFLFMFDMLSTFERKNPLAVVRAFRRAFGPKEKATLLIKVARGAEDAAALELLRSETLGAKIIIVDQLASRAEAYGYIALADAVVSLHRSEGFGLLMAEAMLLGKPVIATNYSGNTAFMTEANSLLVDYELVAIAEDGPIYKKGNRWAAPSEEQAAQYMRRLFEDRAEAAAIGARAKADATRLLSLEAAGARMKARLDEIICSPV